MFHLDPSRYIKGASNSPRYLVSRCPPGYNTTSSESLLCDLHVLR